MAIEKVGLGTENNPDVMVQGNSLEVEGENGSLMLAMSSRAHSALSAEQKDFLLKYYKRIIHSDLSIIEKYGGGSARCMLSELF